jgi:hypothetical protein
LLVGVQQVVPQCHVERHDHVMGDARCWGWMTSEVGYGR